MMVTPGAYRVGTSTHPPGSVLRSAQIGNQRRFQGEILRLRAQDDQSNRLSIPVIPSRSEESPPIPLSIDLEYRVLCSVQTRWCAGRVHG